MKKFGCDLNYLLTVEVVSSGENEEEALKNARDIVAKSLKLSCENLGTVVESITFVPRTSDCIELDD